VPDRKRILIVDDDRDIRMGARLRLRSAGYETIEAANGRLGVNTATECQPDAIVLDVRMPVMDGVEALEQLQREVSTRGIPVVMVSGSPRDETTALDSGARYFVRKPYPAATLLAALDSVISDN
jgi:CheY-like chemotaxis protein